MTKNYSSIIEAKRLSGSKLYYLLKQGKNSKWVDFQQLGDFLDEVIQFQKMQKESQTNKGTNSKIHKQRHRNTYKPQKTIQVSEDSIDGSHNNLSIQNLLFTGKNGAELMFQVWYSDGTTAMHSNGWLRQHYKDTLLNFYENNLILEKQ